MALYPLALHVCTLLICLILCNRQLCLFLARTFYVILDTLVPFSRAAQCPLPPSAPSLTYEPEVLQIFGSPLHHVDLDAPRLPIFIIPLHHPHSEILLSLWTSFTVLARLKAPSVIDPSFSPHL